MVLAFMSCPCEYKCLAGEREIELLSYLLLSVLGSAQP
jgi:hypothetical protein